MVGSVGIHKVNVCEYLLQSVICYQSISPKLLIDTMQKVYARALYQNIGWFLSSQTFIIIKHQASLFSKMWDLYAYKYFFIEICNIMH